MKQFALSLNIAMVILWCVMINRHGLNGEDGLTVAFILMILVSAIVNFWVIWRSHDNWLTLLLERKKLEEKKRIEELTKNE